MINNSILRIMKQKKYLSLVLISLCIVFGCSKMNDKHDFYLQDGEIIYLGRVDSAKVLPGKNRFLLRYWITDQRAKELKIYWNQMRDSLIVPIPVHSPSDSIDLLVGDDKNLIAEGKYTFQLISNNGEDLKSIIYEKLGNVYGEQFSSTLTQRFVRDVGYNPDKQEVTIDWGEPSSSKEIGVEVTYYTGDTKNILQLPTEQFGSQISLINVNVEKGINYRTMFLPEPIAIDTFFTASTPIRVLQNVALFKPVKTSSNLNSSYPGSNAVDGIISTGSRWISSSNEGLEHWIEIDLEKEYNLYSFKLYKHLYNEFFIPNFTFQIQKEGNWIDLWKVENYFGEIYEGILPEEVTTDKVRFFIPKYESNMARIMEIAIYAKL